MPLEFTIFFQCQVALCSFPSYERQRNKSSLTFFGCAYILHTVKIKDLLWNFCKTQIIPFLYASTHPKWTPASENRERETLVLIVFVWVCTIFGGDIADDVYFIHGNLPVGFLFAETQCPALLSVAGVRLNAQEHRALETHDALLKHGLSPWVRCRKGHCAELTLHMNSQKPLSSRLSSHHWQHYFNPLSQHNPLLNSPST